LRNPVKYTNEFTYDNVLKGAKMVKNASGRKRESIINEIQQSISKPSGEKLSYEDANEIADTL
jgi:hypothetical protein